MPYVLHFYANEVLPNEKIPSIPLKLYPASSLPWKNHIVPSVPSSYFFPLVPLPLMLNGIYREENTPVKSGMEQQSPRHIFIFTSKISLLLTLAPSQKDRPASHSTKGQITQVSTLFPFPVTFMEVYRSC